MLNVARYGTKDLAKAVVFYDAITDIIGAKKIIDRDDVKGWRGEGGGMFLIGKPLNGEANVGNGTQMGFSATSRDMVMAVFNKVIELGGTSEGDPGVRGPDGPHAFYAAYFRDLDGNKLMVSYIGA